MGVICSVHRLLTRPLPAAFPHSVPGVRYLVGSWGVGAVGDSLIGQDVPSGPPNRSAKQCTPPRTPEEQGSGALTQEHLRERRKEGLRRRKSASYLISARPPETPHPTLSTFTLVCFSLIPAPSLLHTDTRAYTDRLPLSSLGSVRH